MEYCTKCGTELIVREHRTEGPTPYCPRCEEYRWPGFNTAVSMIVLNPARDKVLLIQQYGKPFYILVAGYVNKGEDAEDAAVREIREEIGAEVSELHFNHSRYFPPSNTLMLNFAAVLRDEQLHTNWEVDRFSWFSVEEAQEKIKPGSLAEAFLRRWFGSEYVWPEYPAR